MADADRQAKIAAYGAAHALLTRALERFPREMWQHRAAPDGWTIHEVIVHITDSEANSYVRCRRFLAEPGSDLMGYDEEAWARALDYHSQSPEDALELFKWLRKKSFDLIRDLPEEVWSRECVHTQDGRITMGDWLDTYARHVPDHIAQMQDIYERWQSAR